MPHKVTLRHFNRAAADIIENGDNDTLPFDTDRRFIEENSEQLAKIAFAFFKKLEEFGVKKAKATIDSLQIYSERLLTPTGPSGFRITTKIHTFWNFYFNALGVAVAEAHEPERSDRAKSYRFQAKDKGLFNKKASWRAYLAAAIEDDAFEDEATIVIKTDVSGFYEHIYHHRIINYLTDFFPAGESTLSAQIDGFLTHFAARRSFGLPVGGQCSRVLAELLMSAVDRKLSDEDINFYRYVDDFTILAKNQAEGYRALSVLSHALADYGLSLNRTKTTFLSAKHYRDYVNLQLGEQDDEISRLKHVDLYFDPYSDDPQSNYEELKDTVKKLEIEKLLKLETEKSQPDGFVISQISRTLPFHPSSTALQLCLTLLDKKNLHAFRGSWSTIMRGITRIRGEKEYKDIADLIDKILDDIPTHSAHLLLPETNCLFYLKAIRFRRTDKRARYIKRLFGNTSSETIKRACIECWCEWKDRASFNAQLNKWDTLSAECQRMLWFHSASFGDEGRHFKKQVKASLQNRWRIGIEEDPETSSFASLYRDWA